MGAGRKRECVKRGHCLTAEVRRQLTALLCIYSRSGFINCNRKPHLSAVQSHDRGISLATLNGWSISLCIPHSSKQWIRPHSLPALLQAILLENAGHITQHGIVWAMVYRWLSSQQALHHHNKETRHSHKIMLIPSCSCSNYRERFRWGVTRR